VGSRGLGSWISTAGALRLVALGNNLVVTRFPARFNFANQEREEDELVGRRQDTVSVLGGACNTHFL
jgi:hypothetical protein